MKGRVVAVAGRFCILSGRDTVPDVPFHLDVGGQVGVWHSDAVMQPGPRDGRGSTNGLGAPMGWLMIVLPTVRNRVPRECQTECIDYYGRAMLAGYGPAIGI